jgi:thiol:disulfide interchange protein DsbA
MAPQKTWWPVAAAFLLVSCGGATDTDVELAGSDAAAIESEATLGTETALVAEAGDAPATGRFRLGAHYLRLSPTQPTSSGPDQVEVAEVFWYGCPHCFAFDPYLERWQATKADYVSFVRVPAVWSPLLQIHARAFYTADALGKGAEMHTEFFREIHERGNTLDTEAKLSSFFGRFGVDAAAFATAFDSFAVHTKLQRADELSRRYGISSVPTVVVNGKFTTDGGQAGSYEDLLELVDTLTAAERDTP